MAWVGIEEAYIDFDIVHYEDDVENVTKEMVVSTGKEICHGCGKKMIAGNHIWHGTGVDEKGSEVSYHVCPECLEKAYNEFCELGKL